MRGKSATEFLCARHQREQFFAAARETQGLALRSLVLKTVNGRFQGKGGLARHLAPFVADRARAGVVAGDQAPELALVDDRQRCGSTDLHVLQVLDVDGRDAAQKRSAEID